MNEPYYIQDQPAALSDPVKLAALKKCDLRSLEEMVRIARLGVADLRTRHSPCRTIDAAHASNLDLLLGTVTSDSP